MGGEEAMADGDNLRNVSSRSFFPAVVVFSPFFAFATNFRSCTEPKGRYHTAVHQWLRDAKLEVSRGRATKRATRPLVRTINGDDEIPSALPSSR